MKKVLLATAIAFLMTGCGPIANYNESNQVIDDQEKNAKSELATQRAAIKNLTVHNDGIFLAAKAIKPKNEFLAKPITFKSTPVHIDVLSGRLSNAFNRPVRINLDLPKPNFTDQEGKGPLESKETLDRFSKTLQIPTNTDTELSAVVMPSSLDYEGTIEGLLNQIASMTRSSWEVLADGSLLFSRFQTKTYHLSAAVGTTKQGAKIGGDGGGGEGATTAIGSSEYQSDSDIWDDISKGLSALKSKNGTFSVSKSSGTIVVKDTFEVLDRVTKYIDTENKMLSSQIYLDVQVLAISFTETDEMGWDLLVKRSLDSAWNGTRGETAGSNSVFYPTAQSGQNTTGSVVNYGIIKDGGNLKIDAFVKALSMRTKVARVTSASTVIQNNQPLPLQVADERAYLKSISSTSVGTIGNTQTQLTPGKVVSGFSMNVLPRVLKTNDEMNELLLQIAIDLSVLKKEQIERFESGANAIQLPEIAKRNFFQRVQISSGDTLILTGFERADNEVLTQGVGGADFYGLGGGRSVSQKRDMIVVIAKPIIIKK